MYPLCKDFPSQSYMPAYNIYSEAMIAGYRESKRDWNFQIRIFYQMKHERLLVFHYGSHCLLLWWHTENRIYWIYQIICQINRKRMRIFCSMPVVDEKVNVRFPLSIHHLVDLLACCHDLSLISFFLWEMMKFLL